MIATQHIQHCFNRAANTYSHACSVQRRAGERLIQLIDNAPNTICDLGCAQGTLTQTLYQQFNPSHLIGIDIAEKMLARAQTAYPHIAWHHQDFDQLDQVLKPAQFDLIFSNMALQWSTDLPKLCQMLRDTMKPDSYFAFTIPLTDTFKELSTLGLPRKQFQSHRAILNTLANAEFDLITSEVQFDKPIFKNVLTALQSIKAVGATAHYTHTPLFQLRDVLQKNKRMTLTYEIGFYLVKRPEHSV